MVSTSAVIIIFKYKKFHAASNVMDRIPVIPYRTTTAIYFSLVRPTWREVARAFRNINLNVMSLLRKIQSPPSTLLWMLCLVYGTISCDIIEADNDVVTPSAEIKEKEIVVLANSPSFIDLNSKLKANIPARAAITSQPRYGELTDLGKGLLQYTPAVGNNHRRDDFEFTFYTANNEIIKRDTIVVIIEDDSTNLPCNIYPRADYVYGVDRNSILVEVTRNDIICGGPVTLSLFQPGSEFPPQFGNTEIVGNKIRYTPDPSFKTSDILVYKLTAKIDTTRSAYGIVYIKADSSCNFATSEDNFIFNGDALDSVRFLPVFSNDSLCGPVSNYRVYLKSSPQRGEVSLSTDGFTYAAHELEVAPLSDHFVYEVCRDGVCKFGRVNITFRKDSVFSCQIQARLDSIDLSNSTIPEMYLGVMENDSICGELVSLKILKFPEYGYATVVDKRILYQLDTFVERNVELQYEICNADKCSTATVYIKRSN